MNGDERKRLKALVSDVQKERNDHDRRLAVEKDGERLGLVEAVEGTRTILTVEWSHASAAEVVRLSRKWAQEISADETSRHVRMQIGKALEDPEIAPPETPIEPDPQPSLSMVAEELEASYEALNEAYARFLKAQVAFDRHPTMIGMYNEYGYEWTSPDP